LIRPIFNADSLHDARDRLSEAVAHLERCLGKIAAGNLLVGGDSTRSCRSAAVKGS